MAFQEDLTDYVERSSALISDSPQMDEQNTKRKIIEPLIDLLGWDILSSDVQLEYSVQMGSGTKKVDYGLKIEDTPVVFVEAKGCDTNLTRDNRNQLKSYMRQVGVDWGLLSNGKELEIFRRDHSSTRPNEVSLANFPLEDIGNNRHILKALSKESIDTGKSQQIAQQIESVQKSVSKLRKNKETVAEEVTEIVTNIIGESVSQQVENEAKTFVDELILSLDDQTRQINTVTVSETPDLDTEGRNRENNSNPEASYKIQLLQNGSNVYQTSGEIQSDVMEDIVNYLAKERNLLNQIETPYVAGTGRGTNALINTEPVHTDGSEMRTYKELPNGYYLHTTLSAKSKKRYIPQLAEKVGLKCEFAGNW